jgi:hypothetical protein
MEDQEWRRQETYKAMMVIPVEGLKILAWINGGAAIAVLTYIGNFTKTTGAQPHGFKTAIFWYCAGLTAASITFLISYLVQMAIWTSLHKEQPMALPPRALVFLGCALAVFGVLAFIMGSVSAAQILSP